MNLFLGFEFAPVEGWEDIMPAPVAPSNYKDPKKIEAYIQKEVAKLRDGKAATDPLCGSVTKAVVLGTASKDGKTKELFVSGAKEPGVELIEFLHRHAGDRFQKGALTLFGHKIHRAMKLCAIEAMAGSTLTLATQWLVDLDDAFRYNRFPGYIDPVSLIFGSSDADTTAICKRFKLAYEPGAKAAVNAQFAHDLALKLGF